MKPRNQLHYHILRNLFQPSESRLKGATIKSNTDTYYDIINVYKIIKKRKIWTQQILQNVWPANKALFLRETLVPRMIRCFDLILTIWSACIIIC